MGASSVVVTTASGIAGVVGIGLVTMPPLFGRLGVLGGTILLSFGALILWIVSLKMTDAIDRAESSRKPHQDSVNSAEQARLDSVSQSSAIVLPPSAVLPVVSVTPDFKSFDYQQLATYASNHVGGFVLWLILNVEYSLFLCVVFRLLADRLLIITDAYNPNSTSLSTCIWIVFGFLGLLSLYRSTSGMAWVAYVGMLGSGLLCGLTIYAGSKYYSTNNLSSDDKVEWLFSFPALWVLGVSIANCTLVFSFAGLIPTLRADMVDKSQFKRVINCAFAVSWVVYLVVGVLGYCAFKGDTVVDGFDLIKRLSDINKTMLWLVSAAVLLMGLSQYAITALVVMEAVDKVVVHLVGVRVTSERSIWMVQSVARLLLTTVFAVIALKSSNLRQLLDIISSFTCVVIVLLFPIVIWWRICVCMAQDISKKQRLFGHAFTGLCVLFGLFVMITGSISVIS